MYKEIILNSAVSGNSSRPTFYLQDPDYCYAFKIISVSIPFTFYTIDTNNQNVTFVEQTSPETTRTASLPVGNYHSASMEAALGDAMSQAGTQVYTVTYDDQTGRLTISAPGAFQVKSGDNGSTAWNIVGISRSTDTATAASIQLPNYADFNFNSSILLCSNRLTSQSMLYAGNQQINVLANVPALAESGSTIYWENQGGFILSEQTLQAIDLILLDSSTGRAIDLNGAAFSVVMGIVTRDDDLDTHRF